MNKAIHLVVLAAVIGATGCQREYISVSDPRFPVGLQQASRSPFWKEKSPIEALQQFASKRSQQEVVQHPMP